MRPPPFLVRYIPALKNEKKSFPKIYFITSLSNFIDFFLDFFDVSAVTHFPPIILFTMYLAFISILTII